MPGDELSKQKSKQVKEKIIREGWQVIDNPVIPKKTETVTAKTGMPKGSEETREASGTNLLELQYPVDVYVIHGSVTGRKYQFLGSGYRLEVDSADAPALLLKTKKAGCCASGSTETSIFRLIR